MEKFLQSDLNKLKTDYNNYYSNDNKSFKSYQGHNPICLCDSNNCSIQKAETVDDLCFWHEQKIGRLTKVSCGCREHYLITGNTISSNLLKDYLEQKNIYTSIAVKDISELYCCNLASNLETKFKCGNMKVCDYCKHQHINNI